jgi:hypothetical protein
MAGKELLLINAHVILLRCMSQKVATTRKGRSASNRSADRGSSRRAHCPREMTRLDPEPPISCLSCLTCDSSRRETRCRGWISPAPVFQKIV